MNKNIQLLVENIFDDIDKEDQYDSLLNTINMSAIHSSIIDKIKKLDYIKSDKCNLVNNNLHYVLELCDKINGIIGKRSIKPRFYIDNTSTDIIKIYIDTYVFKLKNFIKGAIIEFEYADFKIKNIEITADYNLDDDPLRLLYILYTQFGVCNNITIYIRTSKKLNLINNNIIILSYDFIKALLKTNIIFKDERNNILSPAVISKLYPVFETSIFEDSDTLELFLNICKKLGIEKYLLNTLYISIKNNKNINGIDIIKLFCIDNHNILKYHKNLIELLISEQLEKTIRNNNLFPEYNNFMYNICDGFSNKDTKDNKGKYTLYLCSAEGDDENNKHIWYKITIFIYDNGEVITYPQIEKSQVINNKYNTTIITI